MTFLKRKKAGNFNFDLKLWGKKVIILKLQIVVCLYIQDVPLCRLTSWICGCRRASEKNVGTSCYEQLPITRCNSLSLVSGNCIQTKSQLFGKIGTIYFTGKQFFVFLPSIPSGTGNAGDIKWPLSELSDTFFCLFFPLECPQLVLWRITGFDVVFACKFRDPLQWPRFTASPQMLCYMLTSLLILFSLPPMSPLW